MNHNEFDTLLDEALCEYRDAEPLAGLESRVLARISTQREQQRKLWLRWSFVAACAAALTLAIWIGMKTPTSRSQIGEKAIAVRPVETEQSEPPAPRAGVTGVTRAKGPEHRETPLHPRNGAVSTSAANRPTSSKPEQFPAPAPLTEQEDAFLAALNRHPDASRALPDSDLPVAIAEIEIRPLTNTDNPGGNQ